MIFVKRCQFLSFLLGFRDLLLCHESPMGKATQGQLQWAVSHSPVTIRNWSYQQLQVVKKKSQSWSKSLLVETRLTSITSYFEYLFSSWWTCLGTLRRCGFVKGDVPLEAGFQISKDLCHPHVPPLIPTADQRSSSCSFSPTFAPLSWIPTFYNGKPN